MQKQLKYNIIQSNSKGNAVLYLGCILLDCGVTFIKVKPFLKDIQLILLTHNHNDHFKLNTIKKMILERPGIRIGVCEWMTDYLKEFRNIDVFEIGETYNYGLFRIMPIKLYHDVQNCGYRIMTDDYKIIHATDTAHLNGIEANGYDLFALEHNYDEETIANIIEEKQSKGEFSYEKGAINSHLSEQQARDFIFKNKGKNYEVLRLHQSTRYDL